MSEKEKREKKISVEQECKRKDSIQKKGRSETKKWGKGAIWVGEEGGGSGGISHHE